ncbi:hypothetical protein [Chromobacterium phragmitis]|uniref:hypothetical protein n=1 Tax=Chromobacterium phragmitis TaxID=2202141 RepID=UPI0011AE2D89|nr:hypothetical protein [Chromobacterium phragmitis]
MGRKRRLVPDVRVCPPLGGLIPQQTAATKTEAFGLPFFYAAFAPEWLSISDGRHISALFVNIMVMGAPQQRGESLKNEQTLQLNRYVYASTAGTARYPSVTPARSMVFSTFKDVLVGQEFNSSFAEDASEFDDAKISALQKGKTTKAEVIAMLGQPSGQAIYPIIKSKTGKGMIYAYSHVTGTVFNMKMYSKLLIVSLDEQDIVSDVEYTSSGDKPSAN